MLVMLSVPMYLVDAHHLSFAKVLDMKFVLFTNGLLAFGLNMTSMFFMKRCGATTYALTGVVKDIALILLCTVLFSHPMTTSQILGFVVSLIGFQLYNNVKADQNYLARMYYRAWGFEFNEVSESSRLIKGMNAEIEDGLKKEDG